MTKQHKKTYYNKLTTQEIKNLIVYYNNLYQDISMTLQVLEEVLQERQT
jgi:hypothetical protein